MFRSGLSFVGGLAVALLTARPAQAEVATPLGMAVRRQPEHTWKSESKSGEAGRSKSKRQPRPKKSNHCKIPYRTRKKRKAYRMRKKCKEK